MKKSFLLFLLLFCGITCFPQKGIDITKTNLVKVGNAKILRKSLLSSNLSPVERKLRVNVQRITSDRVDTVALQYGNDMVNGIGVGNAATMLPLSAFYSAPYVGRSLIKVNIGLAYDATNVKLHIRTSLYGSDQYTQNVGDLTAGWHTIVLTTPYKISTSVLVIGYEATTAALGEDSYILGITDNTTFLSNACYLEINGINYKQNLGCWAIQGVVSGDNIPQNEIALYSLKTKLVKSNLPFTVKGTIWNLGAKPVASCQIGYSINGVSGSQTVKCDSVKPYDIGNIEINIPAANIAHQDSALIKLNVEKVNEADDEFSDDNSGSTYLTSTDIAYPHRVVAEEGTGAWCGWCVKGIVGIENMKKKYPDTFIPIAIHFGYKNEGKNMDGLEIDPMATYAYTSFLDNYISEYPSCMIDRKWSTDPFSKIEESYNEEQNEPCLFDYKYKLLDYNSSTGLVTATVTAKSAFDYKNANYATAFVVVEDSLTTANPQSNFYANNALGEMGGFENLPAFIVNQNYNDVARGIYSNWLGDPSLPATIAAGTSYDYSYSFTLPPIKNQKNVRIISLLINSETNEIVNAASISLIKNTTGIKALTSKDGINVIVKRISDNVITVISSKSIDANVSLYTVNGELVSSGRISGTQATLLLPSAKGVYMVKVAGKTMKVIL
jgi:hypothetical protein